MSNTVRDVRCTKNPDHYECSVFYKVADGPPPCPCGAPRTPFYATREMEGKAALDRLDATMAQFGTVQIDGKKMNREELARWKADYAHNQGERPENIEFVPVGNACERADFHRHRAWENRRKAGFDTQQFNEYKREQQQRR